MEVAEVSHIDLEDSGLPADETEAAPGQISVKRLDKIPGLLHDLSALVGLRRTHSDILSAMFRIVSLSLCAPQSSVVATIVYDHKPIYIIIYTDTPYGNMLMTIKIDQQCPLRRHHGKLRI
jgi:hypothetical protein